MSRENRGCFDPKKVSHGFDFFREGNSVTGLYEKQFAVYLDDETLLHNTLPSFKCDKKGCASEFDSIHAYEVHFRSCHFNICLECNLEFPSQCLLDFHIEEKHDSYRKAAESKSLNPYKCAVSTCEETFGDTSERNEHLIKMHKYPPNYKFMGAKIKNKKDDGDDRMDTRVDNETKDTESRRVPKSICFGRNSSRGFYRRGGNKGKQQRRTIDCATERDSKDATDISMKELEDAL